MTHQRLYITIQTDWPAGSITSREWDEDGLEVSAGWQPPGWLSDPAEREAWVERHGDTRFFWPKSGRIYQSRSSAAQVLAIIRSHGGDGVIYEAEPQWVPVVKANAARKRARTQARIDRLRDQITALEESL